MKRFLSIILTLLPLLHTGATEENRLKLTIHEAERYLADHNLRLLAEHYAVDQAEARVIQAKLFDNPVISFEQNVYNRINGRYFDFGKEGESAVELEQLIYIAGQHNKRVKLEKINHEMSAYQYEEVARNLRGELRQKFVELYFTRRSLTVYDDEIRAINDLLAIYKTQQEKGNISLLEKARLEALLLALRQEQGDLINQTTALSGELRLLLGINDQTQVEPVIDESALNRIDLSDISFADLLARLPERPDLKIAQSKRRASEADLKLQRALAFPEVSLKGSYDKAGNFINDYWAIGLSISLPIFNRNQGNIKAAKLAILQSGQQEAYEQQQAENELYTCYARLDQAIRLYRSTDLSLAGDFSKILEGVNQSFRQRDISLLEFIDYYESYKTTCLRLNDLKREVLQALEEVNIAAGENLFTY